MANVFKNYTSTNVGASPATVYTVPAATTAVVIGFTVANLTASQVAVDVTMAGADVANAMPLPGNGGYEFMDGGKKVLETGETVIVTSDTATSLDVILSVLEQT